jgi:hypothetical protein
MKRTATIFSLFSIVAILASACIKPDAAASKTSSNAVSDKQDNKSLALPSGAVIIEEEPLGSKFHSDRALILWIVNPIKQPSEAQKNPKYEYNCLDYTLGSYYVGESYNISLINTKTRTVINTIDIGSEPIENFGIPYAIRKGHYYRVEGNASEIEEAKPHIMWLKDYNGDGEALEFALFNSQYCNLLGTTLIGYSERQDKVIQYPIEISTNGPEGRSTERDPWHPWLFVRTPTSPGQWKYDWDDRSHAGPLHKYKIRYDAQKEMFIGTDDQTPFEDK